MKKDLKRLKNTLAAFLLITASSNLAPANLCAESELSFSGGWRQDHFRSFDTTNIDSSTDLVKGSHLNIWQVGVQGWFSPFSNMCNTCLNDFFVRGSAYWGWVTDGIYLHETTPGPASTVTLDRGDVDHGHTWDYTVGGGFLFDLGCGFRAGPTGGYSSNKLNFKTTNVIGVIDTPNTSTAIDPLAYFDEGVLVSSRWQGPWAGLDAFWQSNGWNLYVSYEYHWTRFKGSYQSPSTDLADDSHFSDTISGHKGYGHTGYLGLHYAFCEGLTAGLGVKYNYFHIKGQLVPSASGGFPAVGGSADEVDSVKNTWNSVAVFVDLGYAF